LIGFFPRPDGSAASAARALALLAALASLPGVGVGARATAAAPAPSSVVFRFTDPRIDEASGIAVGIASPSVVYVQNDSGDEARFFALNAATGRTLATYSVPNATNVDWEDIAVARDARGVPSVWLGDIGDNAAARSEIDIYRVDEPHVDALGSDVAATTPTPQQWRLRYPSGASDAESLAVTPEGGAYIVTKSLLGDSQVFSVPVRSDATRVQALKSVGRVRFGFTGTPGGPNRFGQLTATGAALSKDGSVLAVRTYTDAYLWRVGHGGVAAAVHARPVRVALPAQPQGEGITFEGDRLLIDSEGVGSAGYAVALPAAITTPSSPSARPSAASTSVAPSTPTGTLSQHENRSSGWAQIGATVLIVALVAGTAYLMRRRRRGR
jgi:hypothetical protein